jgi:hypothetical protein
MPSDPVLSGLVRRRAALAGELEAARARVAHLKAQQSMAESAVAMLTLTHWQIGVGFLGLVGLALTVHYTRQTARAAIEATRLAKDHAVAELRAYVHLAEVSCGPPCATRRGGSSSAPGGDGRSRTGASRG